MSLNEYVMQRRILVRKDLDMTTAQGQPPSSPITCSVWFGPVVQPGEERDLIDHLVHEHGVGVCCWPRDAVRVEHLAAANVPRLLFVGPNCIPPVPVPGQAWLPTSAGNDEVHAALVELCGSFGPERRRSA
jgi:hypothetical protein